MSTCPATVRGNATSEQLARTRRGVTDFTRPLPLLVLAERAWWSDCREFSLLLGHAPKGQRPRPAIPASHSTGLPLASSPQLPLGTGRLPTLMRVGATRRVPGVRSPRPDLAAKQYRLFTNFGSLRSKRRHGRLPGPGTTVTSDDDELWRR